MVLVADRRAEERHEAVAQKLIHGALVAVHLAERELEEVVSRSCMASAPDTLGERRRADEVGERTVTCLRSPSRAAFEVRIFSARCLGV